MAQKEEQIAQHRQSAPRSMGIISSKEEALPFQTNNQLLARLTSIQYQYNITWLPAKEPSTATTLVPDCDAIYNPIDTEHPLGSVNAYETRIR